MKTINNKRNYFKGLFQIILIILICFVISIILKPALSLYLLIFLFFILLIVSTQKTTESIQISETKVIITFGQFFKRKKEEYPINNIKCQLIKSAAFRGGKYFKLSITSAKQKQYVLDSRDGFTEQEFEEVINEIKHVQSSAVNNL